MRATSDIENALQQRRLGSRAQRPRRRVLRTALSQYFERTAGVERKAMSVLKAQMHGAYFSYRMKDEHNVLKSLFYMPGPHALTPSEGWADVRLPVFLHWLYDKSGHARHVRGHILPLEGDVVMIGFVKSIQNEKGYSGVKILTFKPLLEGPYTRIDAAFMSRYDDRNPDRHYDAGRSVTIRVNESTQAVIAEKVARFLRDMRSTEIVLSDAIVEHFKDYIGEIPLPDALQDMGLSEDEFRQAVTVRAMEGGDVDGLSLMGPIDLGH